MAPRSDAPRPDLGPAREHKGLNTKAVTREDWARSENAGPNGSPSGRALPAETPSARADGSGIGAEDSGTANRELFEADTVDGSGRSAASFPLVGSSLAGLSLAGLSLEGQPRTSLCGSSAAGEPEGELPDGDSNASGESPTASLAATAAPATITAATTIAATVTAEQNAIIVPAHSDATQEETLATQNTAAKSKEAGDPDAETGPLAEFAGLAPADWARADWAPASPLAIDTAAQSNTTPGLAAATPSVQPAGSSSKELFGRRGLGNSGTQLESGNGSGPIRREQELPPVAVTLAWETDQAAEAPETPSASGPWLSASAGASDQAPDASGDSARPLAGGIFRATPPPGGPGEATGYHAVAPAIGNGSAAGNGPQGSRATSGEATGHESTGEDAVPEGVRLANASGGGPGPVTLGEGSSAPTAAGLFPAGAGAMTTPPGDPLPAKPTASAGPMEQPRAALQIETVLTEPLTAKGALHQLRLEVRTLDEHSDQMRTVTLEFRERGGTMELTARSGDAEMTRSLQDSLPELAARLAGHAGGGPHRASQSSAASGGGAEDSGSGQGRDAADAGGRDSGSPGQDGRESRRREPGPHQSTQSHAAAWRQAWRRSFSPA